MSLFKFSFLSAYCNSVSYKHIINAFISSTVFYPYKNVEYHTWNIIMNVELTLYSFTKNNA